MRRLLWTVSYGLLAGILLAGCGGGGGSNVNPPPDPGRSAVSGYVYAKEAGRAARPSGAPGRLVIVRDRLQQPGYRPVPNATVSAPGRPSVQTDSLGHFEIDMTEGQTDVTVVPPPDFECAPATVTMIARRIGGPGVPLPPIQPTDEIYVLPPYAAVEEGDVVQFYALVLSASGPQDISDRVRWRLRHDGPGRPIGELTEKGVFAALRPGSGMVVALLPGEDGETRQMDMLPATADLAAMPPGDMPIRGFAFVEVLPKVTAIAGRVIGSNDVPLRGAFVFASGLPDFAVTEYDGSFFMPLVPPNKPIELTVIFKGSVVGGTTVTVASGEIKEVTIRANIPAEPQPEFAVGILEKPDATAWQYGTHVLRSDFLPGPLPMEVDGQNGPNGQNGPDDTIWSGGGGHGSTGSGLLFPEPGPWPLVYALQSSRVNLDRYVGQFVEVVGTLVPGYPVDGGPPLLDVRAVHPLAMLAADAAGVANAERPRPGAGR